MTDFRALCAELHAAVQLYTGQNPAAAGIPANELVARLMDAMANTAAALAQPEPQAEMVNCHWDGPPPAPHTSVSDWFNEEGSKGILRGLRISRLPSRGGSRQGRPAIEPVPGVEAADG
jgi:hypothetical protein